MKALIPPLCALVFFASPIDAFRAQNEMVVEPRGNTAFHVAYKGGRGGAPDFWCAAGDYVVRELGMKPTTRIYRTTSSPRRPGKGLDFSLLAEGAKPTGLVTLFGDRRSVAAGLARSYCNLRHRAFRD